MTNRDKVFLFAGLLIAAMGLIAIFVLSVEVGVAALLVIVFMQLVLQLLQRRQVARVQQRTLKILRNMMVKEEPDHKPAPNLNHDQLIRDQELRMKKVLGALTSQQRGLDDVVRTLEALRLEKSDSQPE